MRSTLVWSILTLLFAGTLALTGCGGGGNNGKTASLCANNTDAFICEVYKVVSNMTSDTEDPRETDSLAATSPENTEPTNNI